MGGSLDTDGSLAEATQSSIAKCTPPESRLLPRSSLLWEHIWEWTCSGCEV